MKTFMIAAVLSAFAVTASAQSAAEDVAVRVDTPDSAISLPKHPYTMSAADFAKYVGTYELKDGSSVSLFVRGNMKFAALSDGVWHEIVAKSGNSFVARDQKIAIVIDLHDGEGVTGEMLTRESVGSFAKGTDGDHVAKVAIK